MTTFLKKLDSSGQQQYSHSMSRLNVHTLGDLHLSSIEIIGVIDFHDALNP